MKNILVVLAGLVTFLNAASQHEHHHPSMDTVPSMNMHDGMGMLMTNAYSLNLPMNRNGSGTAWLPDASPMYMVMLGNQKHTWMIHGSIFARYNNQDIFNKGKRGAAGVDGPSMLGGMYNKKIGNRSLFTATAMISIDPLTVGLNGYPLLFQSGETYQGSRLVDRQHPHDFFSALSVAYTYAFSKNIDITGYVGYPGEPALGPVAFMHRPSAMSNPNAPLGHHWQDATHITFGVATLGLRLYNFKLESSVFSGREPDDKRYDFDRPDLNSYSYRLSWNPNSFWAFQFSQGFLKEPEIAEPGVNVTRTTASATHSKNLRTLNWSQSLIWGMNQKTGHAHNSMSFLYENHLQLRTQAIYSRYEFVNKSAEELDLVSQFGEQRFNINALTAGYNHRILPVAPVEALAGAQLTFNFTPSALRSLYGKVPIGFQFYLLIRPHRHEMSY